MILLHKFQKQVKIIGGVGGQEIDYPCWGLGVETVFAMRSEGAFWGAS